MFVRKLLPRIFYIPLILIFTLAVTGPTQAAPAAEPGAIVETPAILQFTAGGHVLGFSAETVYLAGLNHALTVQFVNGRGKVPSGEAAAARSEGTPALGRVTYQDMWPGVDVVYSAAQGSLAESTYIVRPGAEPAQIGLQYNVPVQLLQDGTLRFTFETGYMTESAPIAFQEINGQHVPVPVQFALKDRQIGFVLGAYDPKYILTIDPYYVWHTFYGSEYSDEGNAIVRDNGGNLYVAGSSRATWNGPGAVAPLHGHTAGDNDDIVVVKLNSAGAYQWHTYYGSINSDTGNAITIDAGGNIYVAGNSYRTWNGPGATAPLNTYAGGSDIVVLKLSSAGVYQWHTFYGSSDNDYGWGITSDWTDNIYITGYSWAAWDGPGAVVPLHIFAGDIDLVVIALDSATGNYGWHTFYGAAAGAVAGKAITCDGGGNLYVTGDSDVTWNGPGTEEPLHSYAGGNDILVLKLDEAGAYQWHTFYGSSGDDHGYGILSDYSGNLGVAGSSNATWDGLGATAPLHAYTGSDDIVVLALDSAGAYQWHTFYGSSNIDLGRAISSDWNGNFYVTGTSYQTWNGPGGTAPLNANAGYYDIVVLALNSAGTYQWHTFHGASDGERGNAITTNGTDNIYVVGNSATTWNGPGGITPLHAYSGMDDIALIRYNLFTAAFRSSSSQDGWILESGENTNAGGTLNATAPSLRLGDDAAKKQYRSILSFNTGNTLPDNAVITKVTLKVKKQGIIGGGNPVNMFQGFKVDVKKGIFGTSVLQLTDFKALASKTIGPFTPALTSGWYSLNLTSAKSYINTLAISGGRTQIRLYFKLDDNDNTIANYLGLYSGNAAASNQPLLIIEYTLP